MKTNKSVQIRFVASKQVLLRNLLCYDFTHTVTDSVIWAFYICLLTEHLTSSEYCLLETFKGECPDDQIILVTYARYGAMRVGKCIDTERGKCVP